MDFLTINKKSYFQFFFLLAATFLSFSLNAQCNNVDTGGSIGPNQSYDFPSTPDPISNVAVPAGGSGDIQYLWMKTTITGASNSSTVWTIIPEATNEDYQPEALNETTYFIRCARRNGCDEYARESNIITVTIENALPVELISFDAKVTGQDVDLNWTTASEFNHDYFALEHSTNGTDFSEIDYIRGDGNNSDTKKYYSLLHRKAGNGVNYYRLLQVDIDGKSTYSSVIKADVTFDTDVRISPNPTIDLMTVKVSELSLNAAILTLHHANSGQKMRVIEVNEGQTEFKVNTEYLVPGMYVLQVLSKNGTRLAISKFMKANR